WVAVVAALVVLVPSGITIGLTEAASRRTAPLPSPSASAPVPNPTTTNPTVVNPSDLPDCGESQLSIAVVAGQADPDSWEALIGFTNASAQACTIRSYPTVVAVDDTGATVTGVGVVTPSSTEDGHTAVALAPGEQAGAKVYGTSSGNGCK